MPIFATYIQCPSLVSWWMLRKDSYQGPFKRILLICVRPQANRLDFSGIHCWCLPPLCSPVFLKAPFLSSFIVPLLSHALVTYTISDEPRAHPFDLGLLSLALHWSLSTRHWLSGDECPSPWGIAQSSLVLHVAFAERKPPSLNTAKSYDNILLSILLNLQISQYHPSDMLRLKILVALLNAYLLPFILSSEFYFLFPLTCFSHWHLKEDAVCKVFNNTA